ncbi:hypothetical protein BDN67DRAFT_1011772 [Paxillus ammoniavirescens]|nr:hypothetical protein BDN67DRAFT_1011772 [Paxillus ammoniavirescens]
MSSTSKNPAGRPPAKIITDHFNQLEKVGNKSGWWYYECKYCGPSGVGTPIENRDNKPLKHISNCPNAPQSTRNAVCTYMASKTIDLQLPDPIQETPSATGSEESTQLVKAPKRRVGTLMGYADTPLTQAQQEPTNVKLFRFIVHANIAFSAAENWFFRNFMDELRPSYNVPSRYVLSHSIMDAELCRVQLEEVARVKERKRLTFLLDGWEDLLKRSLYGALAAEINQYPIVLKLADMTGR